MGPLLPPFSSPFLQHLRSKSEEKSSILSLSQSFELTLSERLRIQSVDLESFKSISSLSSPSPSLVLIL
jgi:hypothetical protein